MFFILSKVLYFLLVPFWWIILLFIWMLLSKSDKRRKQLRIIILCIFIIFSNPFIYRSTVLAWQPEPVQLPADAKYEVGILLGGLAGYDKYGRGYFGSGADRFIQTANLYHKGNIKKIIITGGTGKLAQDEPAESHFLRASLIDNGIPDSVIFIESQSRNTYENAVYSKKIIDSLHAKPPYVLITSALHIPRSKSVFMKAGYDFVAYPCDYHITPQKLSIDNIFPNASLLNEWSFFIKEMVGLAVYKATGKA